MPIDLLVHLIVDWFLGPRQHIILALVNLENPLLQLDLVAIVFWEFALPGISLSLGQSVRNVWRVKDLANI